VTARELRADTIRRDARHASDTGTALQAQGDFRRARAWFERAHRLVPEDPAIAFALAGVLLQAGEPGAVKLLEAALETADTAELWLTLAAAQLKAGEAPAARSALGHMLSSHVLTANPATISALANLACAGTSVRGWCAVASGDDGTLAWISSIGDTVAVADGIALSKSNLPANAKRLEITHRGKPLLGSPIDLRALRRVEGFVESNANGLSGWAWHPADPGTAPWITVTSSTGRIIRVRADDESMEALRPMSRPRRFSVPSAALARLEPPLVVTGPDAAALMGSPVTPGLETQPAGRSADFCGPAAKAPLDPSRPVALVIPVYRNFALTRQCLDSVFATITGETPVIVVDDATPEPALAAWLDDLAEIGRIILIRHTANRGFPASANAGLEAAFGLAPAHDALLLNSDTILPAGKKASWLARLRDCVHAAGDIGTATPLSNDASILSYPLRDSGNPIPNAALVRRMDDDARRANAGVVVDIPTGVGFCLYIRRECAEQAGLFNTEAFAQGYGEENDFCIRARHLGWRHVAVPGVFVGHASHASFGAARIPLMQRNLGVLERMHPGYRAMIAAYQQRLPAQDALAPFRRRIDARRWVAARQTGSVLLVSHDSGGGVEKLLRARCEEIAAAGQRAIVLRPVAGPEHDGTWVPGLCRVSDGAIDDAFPNLVFDLRHELTALASLLREDRPTLFEVHHRLGHDPAVMALAAALGLSVAFRLHDYAAFCPRVTLFGAMQTYCGEPTEIAECEACVATAGPRNGETIGVAALRARSASEFAAASSVVVPSSDMASRMRRHFLGLRCIIAPHEIDPPASPPLPKPQGSRRIAVIGGITADKGFNVLLACARDAAEHSLDLEFVLVGHSENDAALMETGRVFVTGRYREGEAEALIRAQSADLAFLPSIVPESWGFTLGLAWRAGLRAAVFDLGAMAARVKASGYGIVLPLGLPAHAINRQLMLSRGETVR
jgi:GT2 family glycosyltransferase/glycosyltransferase involved in cell wall biosynthesis